MIQSVLASATSRAVQICVAASCWLLMALSAPAQISMSGANPPVDQSRAKQAQLSLAEKAARGEAPLSRRYPEIKIDATRLHRLPALDRRAMKQGVSRHDWRKQMRVGAVRQFARQLEAMADTTAYQVAEGRLALARVVSEGAWAVRLHFTSVAMPEGARLFVYSLNNPDEFYGPYQGSGLSGSGEFWTPPVAGDGAVIEYFMPNSSAGAANEPSPFRIGAVSHIFRDLRAASRRTADAAGPCQQDVTAAWRETAKSVALITFATPKGEFACTGTLVNGANLTPYVHYLLTANHCVPDEKTARTVFAYFLFDGGETPPPPTATASADMLVTGTTGDFTLLRLVTSLPEGVRYAGWTTQTVAPATAVTGIHHPAASHKRIAFGTTVTADCPDGIPGQGCDNFLKVRWNSGMTEPGSSGSALWAGNASDPKIVGVLTGGTASCANPSGTNYYGRFEAIFPALSYFLTGQGCAFKLSETERFIGASGGSGSVNVTPRNGTNCSFTAASSVPWIRITSGSNVTLPTAGAIFGAVTYSVEVNTGAAPRVGTITIAGQTVTIYQAGVTPSCQSTAIAAGQTASSNLSAADCRSAYDPQAYADRYTFNGKAGQQVAIELRSSDFDTFLTLLGPDGSVIRVNDDGDFTTNSRLPLAGYLTLPESGQYTLEVSSYEPGSAGNYQLTLSSTGCVFAIAQRHYRIGAAGGSVEVNVEVATGSSCNWGAISDAPWIGASYDTRTGSGTYTLHVAYHLESTPRTGTVYVAGLAVTITQEGVCTYSLSPSSMNMPATGGMVTVTINHVSGNLCDWSAQSDGSLVFLNTTRDGDGGTATYRVDPNTNLFARTLTAQIARQTFTVVQQGAANNCQNTPITVGRMVNGTLTASDCRGVWLSAGYNLYADRYTFTGISGQRLAIALSSEEFKTQVFLFGPDGIQLARDAQYGGGANNSRLEMILPADGTYTIEASSYYPNEGGAYILEITPMSNPGCVIWPSTLHQSFSPSGATGSVNVVNNVGGNCAWQATSNVLWITFPDGASGTGAGTLSYSVSANTAGARTGIISLAGYHIVVGQDGAGLATVSAANYERALAPESIAAVFGASLAKRSISASQLPLPTKLWDAQVIIKDSTGTERPAPLFYVSPGQINFQIPESTAPGEATVKVLREDGYIDYLGPNSTGTLLIDNVAPSLFSANATGRGIAAALLLRIRGTDQLYEPVFEIDAAGNLVARPIDLGPDSEQVYLLLFGTGIRKRSTLESVSADISGTAAQVTYAGAQPNFVGLDQINIPLPKSLRGKGEVEVTVTVDGKKSNAVGIKIAGGQ